MLKLTIKSLVDKLTGQIHKEAEYTNARVSSATSTTLTGSNQALTSITVPSGIECVIYKAYVYGSAATQYALTYTQTTTAGVDTQTAYYELQGAGSIDDTMSVKEPIMAMINGTTGNVTIDLNVVSATSGNTYTGNVWYILR